MFKAARGTGSSQGHMCVPQAARGAKAAMHKVLHLSQHTASEPRTPNQPHCLLLQTNAGVHQSLTCPLSAPDQGTVTLHGRAIQRFSTPAQGQSIRTCTPLMSTWGDMSVARTTSQYT